jgi:palmitoyl-protein thioesterase
MHTLLLYVFHFVVLVAAAHANSQYLPIVLWHGLGDEYDSVPMQRVIDTIQDTLPGIFIHSVRLDEDGGNDQRKSFFGNATEEVEYVCNQLANVTELQNGFNAIGFSQGGLFLRAYVERCNNPPMRTLATFGTPHNGIADLPPCRSNDFFCKTRNNLLKTQIWTDYAQSNVITAQYYRDPEEIEQYLEYSSFLADINNERLETQNATYADRLSTLERLVLILFSDDVTVVPKESAWFQEVNRTTGKVTSLEKRPLYLDDWIGLRTLGENDLIDYLIINGAHMQFSEEELRNIVTTYMATIQEPEEKLIHQIN